MKNRLAEHLSDALLLLIDRHLHKLFSIIFSMNILKNNHVLLASGLIVVAGLSRLAPHPGNFTAVGAMAIFAGNVLPKRWSFVLPILALWLSDLLLNNIIYREYYPTFSLIPSTLLVTYLPMLLVWGMSNLTLKTAKPSSIMATSLLGSVLFFLVSNFFVWAGASHVYSPNFSGLMVCYTAGLPFLLNQIAGDLFFCGLLFGMYSFAQNRLQLAKV